MAHFVSRGKPFRLKWDAKHVRFEQKLFQETQCEEKILPTRRDEIRFSETTVSSKPTKQLRDHVAVAMFHGLKAADVPRESAMWERRIVHSAWKNARILPFCISAGSDLF